MKRLVSTKLYFLFLLFFFCTSTSAKAQTETDFDMMSKKLFCSGFLYSHSSWDNYWEGTFKRENLNLGKVTTQMIAYMGNYGISNKLNVIVMVPYVKTKASAGTMSGLDGMQDLSLFVKWKPLTHSLGTGKISLMGVAGVSTPLSDYVADFLPFSIGLRSQTLSARIIADYSIGKFFATGSGAYVYRNNIEIDRDVYYTTEMHLTNEVEMPNAATFNFRTGYRTKHLILEAIVNNWTTLGGFDITKNNMPFPSNKMNMTTGGVKVRLEPKQLPNLSIHTEGNYTLAGRNVGQALTINAGLFYILNFNRKSSSTPTNAN